MKKYMIVFALIFALALSTVSEVSAVAPPFAGPEMDFPTELVTESPAATIHHVEPGDTLWAIAQEYDVSVEDINKWNGLTSSIIHPDQELKIKDDTKKYIVKKGDTLSKIAKEHNISLNDLMAWNQITSYLIHPDDQLKVSGIKNAITVANVELHPTSKSPQAPVAKKTEAPKTTVAKTPAPSTQAGKEMTMTATAYTAYCEGCSGITYTGIDLRSNPNQKVIAVDPRVIPLGSRVWVEGYGEAIAGDIGGAIKGNIIDVFLQHRADALNWGRRTVKIKILD